MTDTTYLGVIAFSTLVMALIQVSVLVALFLMMKRVQAVVTRVEDATRPLLAKIEDVTRETSQSIAAARLEISRGGEAVAHILERVEETVGRVDSIVATPAREGAAIVAGARAVVHALRRPFVPAGRAHAPASHDGEQQRGGQHGGQMRTSGVPM